MNKARLLIPCVIIAVTFLISCNNTDKPQPAGTSPFDMAAARKEVDAANKQLSTSLANGDSATAADVYAADAEFMGPNAPAVKDRKNIAAQFGGMIHSGATKLDVVTVDLWGGEELLGEEGTYTLATKDGHQLDKGKYIVLWKKEAGKWKVFRDCLNSDLPK
ncbi:MAG: hypothetical protein JWM28_3430 [Chitinophagaceae bacterium]|nr:hypothetical protein [Chitinophagaceae bacterium]